MSKILVFGAGSNAEVFTEYVKAKTNHQIVGYIDNSDKTSEKNPGGVEYNITFRNKKF